NKLLDDLTKASAEGGRFVILSPTAHENHGPGLPNPKQHNEQLRLYTETLKHLAAERRIRFIDLFSTIVSESSGSDHPFQQPEMTNDSAHLNETGYAAAADEIEKQLLLTAKKPTPDTADQIEQLRRAIIEKNRLYFHRWRPQNTTYLFGFRKHEQGQNAAEVAEFEKLVAEKETEIDRLKRPVAHTYELVPVKE
ncbi:MAG: hypothetical protein ACREIV_09620, partial [Planctomycetaceae bacterium]